MPADATKLIVAIATIAAIALAAAISVAVITAGKTARLARDNQTAIERLDDQAQRIAANTRRIQRSRVAANTLACVRSEQLRVSLRAILYAAARQPGAHGATTQRESTRRARLLAARLPPLRDGLGNTGPAACRAVTARAVHAP